MTREKQFFGTDGIRSKIGNFPMTADFVLKLGWAVGKVLATTEDAKVIIGKDTRISGYMIESALQAGLVASGMNVCLLGPMPTPAIAYLAQTLRANAGIVISASHNEYEDNGIKFFSPEGYKISAETERAIEIQLTKDLKTASSLALGRVWRMTDAAGRYVEYCKSSVPHHTNFKGLKIIIDCSNGATYHIAPHVFSELGAQVTTINGQPNGFNINKKCGSNHPDVVREYVINAKADLGMAFDGDGDRVILVDREGDILDGDELLYIITKGLLATKRIVNGVIGTTMSNMGLEIALRELGIAFARVAVGDQNVIAALKAKKWQLGGEPSGHIIYLYTNTTADGIIGALQVLQTMMMTGKSLHELKIGMEKFPQKIINVPHNGVKIDLESPEMISMIKGAQSKLGKKGRVFVRYSGTEQVIRLMVEGENPHLVDTIINELKDSVNVMLNQKSSINS
jgi:phosphoglucosamine mutase